MFTSQRVLELLARGQITGDEADSLLANMRSQRGTWHRFTHPFERLRLGYAWLLGCGAAVCGLLLGELGIRFDGGLDLHLRASAVPWSARLGDLVASFPVFAAVFWIGLRTMTKQVRLIDVIAAVGLARVSYMPTAALLALIGAPPSNDGHASPIQTAGLALVALFGLVWLVTWLCTGIRAASGLTGTKFSVAFVSLTLVAELVSKLAVYLIA
jgi:hypothetical protein